MSRPNWPGYNEKTGNPTFDNESRRLNRHLWSAARGAFRVTAPNRRRKRVLLRVEGGTYVRLLAAAALRLARERRADQAAPTSVQIQQKADRA